MGELQPWHIFIVALIAIMLFGSKRLPDTARALGQSLRIFKAEAQALREQDVVGPPAIEATRTDAQPAARPPVAPDRSETQPARDASRDAG